MNQTTVYQRLKNFLRQRNLNNKDPIGGTTFLKYKSSFIRKLNMFLIVIIKNGPLSQLISNNKNDY